MSPLLRSPLLHFLALGALLFFGQSLRATPPATERQDSARIVIGADRLQEMQTNFAAQAGRRPATVEVDRMITAEVDEEIFFREAIARGLLERDSGVQTRLVQKMMFLERPSDDVDQNALLARAVELGLHREDIVVRRILIQKMKLLGSALRADQHATEADIATAYHAAAETLRAPDRRSLSHVFFSSDRRGASTGNDAAALGGALMQQPAAPEKAITQGDPFPLGHQLEKRSRHDLERSFGANFGSDAFALDLKTWSRPIASAYGQHLVFIRKIDAGEVPPLDQVSNRLRLEIEEQRRDDNLAALVSDLRTRYQIVLPGETGEAFGTPKPKSQKPPPQDPAQFSTPQTSLSIPTRPTRPHSIQEETG